MILMILHQAIFWKIRDGALGESLNSGFQSQNNLHAKGPTSWSIIPCPSATRKPPRWQKKNEWLSELSGSPASQGCFECECNPMLWNDMRGISRYIIYTAGHISYVLYYNIHILDPDGWWFPSYGIAFIYMRVWFKGFYCNQYWCGCICDSVYFCACDAGLPNYCKYVLPILTGPVFLSLIEFEGIWDVWWRFLCFGTKIEPIQLQEFQPLSTIS